MDRCKSALIHLKNLVTGWRRVIGAGEMWSLTLAPGVTGLAYADARRQDMPWRSGVFMQNVFVSNGPSLSRNSAMRTAEMVGRFAIRHNLLTARGSK